MRPVAGLDLNWDDFVAAHPQGHILQTTRWGQLKARFGWHTQVVRAGLQGALVLFRPLPLGFSLAYIPRGPLADWTEGNPQPLIEALDAACHARRAICLKVEPDLPDTSANADRLASLGWRPSPQAIQPRRTIWVDLSGAETDILGRMKQKTRYNIGLAVKKGVTARLAEAPQDLQAFLGLMRTTGQRDGFGVHTDDYYRTAYELFQPAGQCAMTLAEYQGEALAGAMVFALGQRAWYFYGVSSDRERNRMAPYLAQWAAMQWVKGRGVSAYDLWGIPDENEAALEAQFESRHDGLWGVYRFKRGFGGQVTRTLGAWDRIYNPALYQAYLATMRLRGRSEA
jgi:lipid II:glycine glycyltransferase (peptidoglycan interpeptide bridge formation enzyme)